MRYGKVNGGIGVLLIAVILLGFMSYCRFSDVGKKDQSRKERSESWEEGYEAPTLRERGYLAYREAPEPLVRLLESGIFKISDEEYREIYLDEYGEEDAGDMKQQKAELETEYSSSMERFYELGKDGFLDERILRVGENDEDFLMNGCVLHYDPKAGKFTDTDRIATIEGCGFTGFSGLLSEIEKRLEKNQMQIDEDEWAVESSYFQLYCQGVQFGLSRMYNDNFQMNVVLNYSTFYAPGEYEELVNSVTADGTYFLSASQTGGERDVLVFCRNDSVSDLSGVGGMYGYTADEANQGDKESKKISFIFRDGKLEDLYATSWTEGKLKLDDKDQEFLDTYTGGLGKKLDVNSSWGGVIFRTR